MQEEISTGQVMAKGALGILFYTEIFAILLYYFPPLTIALDIHNSS